MLYGICSDIHANAIAFEAVLTSMKENGVERRVCLGDLVGYGAEPDECVRLLKKVGACFMFAQKYHTSMKYVGSIRKELGIRTVFNILGPITNPAKPAMILLGVYDPLLVEPLARVLTGLGMKRGMVVHGTDCLDEISVSAPTLVCEFNNGNYKAYEICPEDFGLLVFG